MFGSAHIHIYRQPFLGNFRINVNLFNPDTGTTARYPSSFGDTGNDYDLSVPVSTIELTGTNTCLMQWKEGHRVAISNEPFGNMDNTISFHSGVNDLQMLEGIEAQNRRQEAGEISHRAEVEARSRTLDWLRASGWRRDEPPEPAQDESDKSK